MSREDDELEHKAAGKDGHHTAAMHGVALCGVARAAAAPSLAPVGVGRADVARVRRQRAVARRRGRHGERHELREVERDGAGRFAQQQRGEHHLAAPTREKGVGLGAD
jgi:hypothetical protein